MTELAASCEPKLWRTATAVFTASLISSAVFGCRSGERALVPAEAPAEQRSVPESAREAPRESAREAPSSRTRSYAAELAPLNAHLSRRAVTGYATFVVNMSDATIRAGLFAEGLSADYAHPQWVHGAPRLQRSACPGPDADDNGDRVVDVGELARNAGPPLIPLNQGDLSVHAGPLSFPLPSESGVVDYVETAPLGALRHPLGRTTVVLYGVAPDVELPSTMRLLHGLTAPMSVPIACGQVVEVL